MNFLVMWNKRNPLEIDSELIKRSCVSDNFSAHNFETLLSDFWSVEFVGVPTCELE